MYKSNFRVVTVYNLPGEFDSYVCERYCDEDYDISQIEREIEVMYNDKIVTGKLGLWKKFEIDSNEKSVITGNEMTNQEEECIINNMGLLKIFYNHRKYEFLKFI